MLSLVAASVAMATPNVGSTGSLYGLALVTNGPATMGLATVDGSGATKMIGPAHSELFGCSDTVAIAHGMFFYLGDTSAGADIVALNLTDGSKVCSKNIELAEVGYVGLGQTLDYDESSDTLVLSGINLNKTGHNIYRGSARGCGPFTAAGSYNYSDYIPMLHASSLDTKGQRLFVSLGTSSNTGGIGVVDLTGKKPTAVITEGAPDPDDALVGMHWDAKSGKLVGIYADPSGLFLHAVDPASQKWDAPKPVTGVPTGWNALLGNSGSVSTFDAAARNIIFLAGEQDGQGNIVSSYVCNVDVDDASLKAHPKMQPQVGLGGSGFLALEMTGDEVM